MDEENKVVQETVKEVSSDGNTVTERVTITETPKKGVGISVASLVLGIIAFCTGCCFWYVTVPCGLISLILGLVSVNKKHRGSGMGIAGIVLSILSLVACAIMLLTGLSLIAMDDANQSNIKSGTRAEASASNTGTSNKMAASKDEAVIGSRTNPAKMNDVVTYKYNSFMYGSADLELQMTDMVRGDDAYQLLLNANQFTPEADNGREYVIAMFKVTNVKSHQSGDEPTEVNYTQFDYADSQYVKEDQFNISLDLDLLKGKLYEGSTAEGLVLLEAKPGEQGYIVFDDNVWFALN